LGRGTTDVNLWLFFSAEVSTLLSSVPTDVGDVDPRA
jgi:hypothetical protein